MIKKSAALLVTLALISASSLARPLDHLDGKTKSQVLAMGLSKWVKYVSANPKWASTQGISDAEDFYVDAAKERNGRLMRKTENTRDQLVSSVEVSLSKTGEALITAEKDAAGGGSMYQTFYPYREAEVQDFVYAMLTHGGMSHKSPDDAKLKALYDAFSQKQLSGEGDKQPVQTDLAEAKKQMDILMDTASVLDKKESDGVRAMLGAWLNPDRG